jgi:hypothetical protein
MSDACNTATILTREHFSGQEEASAPYTGAAYAPAPAMAAGRDAAACVQAGAVLDVVERLAAGHTGEGATIARNGAAWTVQKRHHCFWAARVAEGCASIRPAENQLHPLGSFGAESLVTPCGLEPRVDGTLWVTSLGGERLSALSPQGELVRHVPLPGARPWGLFQAGQAREDSLWVCDFANALLLRIGLDGRLEQRLPVRVAGQDLRPILGAANAAEIFLILADGSGRNRRLARLRADDRPEDGDGAAPELLPCPVAIPSGVRVRGGRLFVSSQNPPALLSRPLAGGAWTGFSSGLLPEYLTQFAFAGEHTWLASRGRLARLGKTGAVELVVDAATLAGYPESNFCGLAALDGPDGPRLFVADNIHNLIHAFQLA